MQMTVGTRFSTPQSYRKEHLGEITGAAKGTIGETEQEYPTLRIKDLTKWEKSEVRRWTYPYPYPYPYSGGYYWHGAGPFAFRYW